MNNFNKFLWEIMKTVVLIILIVGGFIYFGQKVVENLDLSGNLGGNYNVGVSVLAGSATNAVSIPKEMVFANSTTTDEAVAAYPDGGHTIIQALNTEGMNYVRLNMLLLGGTATSTFAIRQQLSSDNSVFYDIHGTSTAEFIGATTTLSLLPRIWQVDPGTASTSYSLLFDTLGAKYTRFVFWGEDVATDPSDGIQAWIQVNTIEPLR